MYGTRRGNETCVRTVGQEQKNDCASVAKAQREIMKESKELEVVELMIRLYCKNKHKCKDGLCTECNELLEYVKLRRSKCPWGDKKPFCSNCKIHCYKPDMRTKIKDVMKFSGPRIVFRHPIIAVKHLIETKRQKKKLKKEEQKSNVR